MGWLPYICLAFVLSVFIPVRAQDREFEWSGDSLLFIGWQVESIPERTFEDSPVLRRVIFRTGPEGQVSKLRSVGEYAFSLCPSLESISFPDSVRDIAPGVFYGCVSLKKVSLPEGVKRIPSHAFAYCESLAAIRIPESVTHIGNNAFSRCSSLEEIVIPDSVIMLESYAFSDCSSLRYARLPANPSMLGELIFSGCISLEVLEEPSSVPPEFDCASFIFEPDETVLYRKVKLIVPPESVGLYRVSPGWKLFY